MKKKLTLTERLMISNEIRLWTREVLGRDDIELPSLAKLNDADLQFINNAMKLRDHQAYLGE